MHETAGYQAPQYRGEAAGSMSDIRGKAERDASPIDVMLERLGEDLEKAQHVLSGLEARIDPCLTSVPSSPGNDAGKPGLESVAGSKLEERLQRIRNQAQGLTERMVRIIDRVRL